MITVLSTPCINCVEKNIPGILFMGLTREELEKYGISVIGVRVIMALQEKNSNNTPQ